MPEIRLLETLTIARVMKKLILLFFFLSGNLFLVSAQPFNIDLNFAVGAPQGGFAEELDRNSYGLDIVFTYQIPYSPIHIGAGIGYQNYGWKQRSTYIDGIPEVDLDVRTTNNIITPHLLARIEAPYGFVQPFIEGSMGFNYLYTETSLIDDYHEEDIASDVNHDYITTNSGLGGGFKINLYEGFDEDGDYRGISLMMKAKYMLGGNASYLREGDLIRNGNFLDLNIRESRTDLVTFNIGVSFNF